MECTEKKRNKTADIENNKTKCDCNWNLIGK